MKPQNWYEKFFRGWQRFLTNPYEHLLWSLILIFLAFAVVDENNIFGQILLSSLFFLTVLFVIETFRLKQKFLNIFRAIALLSFTFNLISIFWDDERYIIFHLADELISFGFIAMAIIVIIKKIFSDTKVTKDTLSGGISVYLMLGILWYQIYQIILMLVPNAFKETINGYQVLYFSFVTLTTTGYGDILPAHKATMMMSNLEAVVGQLYPAIIIARLVSLYIAEKSNNN